MFLSWRKVVSLFPLYCPCSPVAYAPSVEAYALAVEGITAKFQSNSF